MNESNLVEVNSSFQGRTFLQQEYDQIVLFDDISGRFNGTEPTFTLTSAGSTMNEVENGSGVLVLNDIYQTPTTDNNDGNNYFYTFGHNTGINSVTFTGVTSTNGSRVQSEFDVNQNQLPRGGMIVSLGSTPGLGYAPLVGAALQPIVVAGAITGVHTTDQVGVTTAVRFASYDNLNGELVVTAVGAADTATGNITDATYLNTGGALIVTVDSSLSAQGVVKGDIVVLDGLEFSCTSGSGTTTIFPDRDDAFAIVSVIDDNRFSVDVGISTLEHTYVSGGTFQKHEQFEFGQEGTNPMFVHLDSLDFTCPNGETVGLTTTVFPIAGEEAFPFITQDDGSHFRVLVGVSTINHQYASGGTISQYTKNRPGFGYNSRVEILVEEEGHSGTPAEIVGIPTSGGSLAIQVINPGTGYTNPTLHAPDPDYFNLPITGVFRRRTGFTTECGENLFVACKVGASKTTAIGRSEFFEVSEFEITNQGYSFEDGDIIEVVGLATDTRLSAPIAPFQLTIVSSFTDNFSSWNFGELDYIDSIKPLQDGARTRFPLIYNGEQFSFEQNPGDENSAAIDLDAILLIYVNTVLQTLASVMCLMVVLPSSSPEHLYHRMMLMYTSIAVSVVLIVELLLRFARASAQVTNSRSYRVTSGTPRTQ